MQGETVDTYPEPIQQPPGTQDVEGSIPIAQLGNLSELTDAVSIIPVRKYDVF